MGGCVSVCYRRYNLIDLKAAVDELEEIRDELLRRVAREEDLGRQRVAQVQVWFTKVEVSVRHARELISLLDGDEGLHRGNCCWSTSFMWKFGKEVHSLLKIVEQLKCDGYFVVAAERPIYDAPVLPPVSVGQDRTYEKTRQFLMEDGVGILGLYGMGGVGKTSLLSRLYNVISAQDLSPPPFDLLIWLLVSQSVQIHVIQDNIGKSLHLYNDEEWARKSESQKAMSIYYCLRGKRFLVVLDDLWGKLDLAQVGIPLPTMDNGCKIIISTRSRYVCEVMGADAFIEVSPFEYDDAWALFCNTVGETTLQRHQEIRIIARRIAHLCGGLPLLLKVVGACMSSKSTIQEWQHALNLMISSVPMPPPDTSILCILKPSYDALEGKQVKLCFLFCALFPGDHKIRKEDLVELWIGEGVLDDNHNDPDIPRRQGYEIIRILLAKSLIEAGESRGYVKLHYLLRTLALHIASHPEEDRDNFISESYTQVGDLSNIKNWRNDVARVSFIADDIKTLSGDFDCPKLKTLLLRDTKLETISPGFFSSLPALLVLDMSSNTHLNILPDAISKLDTLRYLNLSSTGIKRLPRGLSKLKRLTYLNLEHTHMLTDITGISDLVNIQVLGLCDSGFRASCTLLGELQLLEHLQLLTITLQDEDVVQQFLSCPKLAECTQGFYLNYCALLSTLFVTSISGSLRCLDVQDSYIPEMKIDISIGSEAMMITRNASPSHTICANLNEVRLDGCNGLRELTWLLFAPNLTILRVVQSRDIEEIISKGKAANMNSVRFVPFHRLVFLALESLDKLRSIYWNPLPLPELREIRVRSCPVLTKLPVNSESAKGQNLVVSAEKELMQRIEWEDSETKQRLFPS